MDDDVVLVPATLSAALALEPDDESAPHEVSVATAIAHFLATRDMSTRRATAIALTGKCDECRCLIGSPPGQSDCECPCHCKCCCPPLFHCMRTCNCECACHYQHTSEEEGADNESEHGAADQDTKSEVSIALAQATESPTPASPGALATPTQTQQTNGENAQVGGGEQSKQRHGGTGTAGAVNQDSDSDDEMEGTPPIAMALDHLSATQLAELLSKQLAREDEQAELNSRRVLQALFALNHVHAQQGRLNEKSPNKHLPALTDSEMDQLLEYVRVLYKMLKRSPSRINNDVRDVATAAVRSTWPLARIIDQRATAAKLPREPPTNVWAHKTMASPTEEHAFATATREPTTDEWNILMGMMAGKIIASSLPQFFKRICTITQCLWIHHEIIQRTEGELWVVLPRLTKMFNFNQTTRRLVADIRQSAKHQGWTDQRLDTKLARVKFVAYNQDMHSIHLYFYTKAEAVQFEGMKIPFRTSKLLLLNPDTKLRRSANAEGLPTDDDDGLINDRYQAQHKIRMLNAARTVDLLALVAYLQMFTDDGLKSACPLDTYGPHAEGSVSWDIFCKTAKCPPKLENIHRIDYIGHTILLLHRPEGGPPPCLNCAKPGHQAAACKTPKEDWYATTLVITADDIAPYVSVRKPWSTMEEMQATFASFGIRQETSNPTQPEGAAAGTVEAEATSSGQSSPPAEPPAPPTNQDHEQSDPGETTTPPTGAKDGDVQSESPPFVDPKPTKRNRKSAQGKPHQQKDPSPASGSTVINTGNTTTG